ncbi:MAG: ATP-binding protein [Anaerolineae bacterium]|jgi:MinD superfamily P-loop ATPase|nr:ATP-binding protein [Anaerolineae bacterium]
MRVAIASGKGGTGKTTVAVSLALSLAEYHPLLLDCDVEEPNAALFLRPAFTAQREVGQWVPVVNPAVCTGCGRCAEVCEYHAITVVGKQVFIFPELCHGCGSCSRQCPVGALHEDLDVIGSLDQGQAEQITFFQGTLNVGEAMAVPVIRQLKQWGLQSNVHQAQPVILDAPPGASCPVVETLRGADAVLLVTEPTPFGLHDLRVAVEVVREMETARGTSLPVAVVVNRDGAGDSGVDAFCAAEGIPILMRIPLERGIAEGIAQGKTLIDIYPEYGAQFAQLWQELVALR